jgi:hypothetical protein
VMFTWENISLKDNSSGSACLDNRITLPLINKSKLLPIVIFILLSLLLAPRIIAQLNTAPRL